MSAKLLTASGGGVILDAANTATDKTLTLPALDDTVLTRTTNVTSGTAVASTSGTSIDFTGIPSWVKRITVLINGVSTNGASPVQVQIGAGSVTTSGYGGSGTSLNASATSTSSYTGGFAFGQSTQAAVMVRNGNLLLTLVSGNIWAASGLVARSDGAEIQLTGGVVTLGGVLDRVRITTVNGTDTFDAGSINILYE